MAIHDEGTASADARRSRVEAMRRSRRSRERRRAGALWTLAAVGLAGVVGAFFYGVSGMRAQRADAGLDAVRTYEVEQDHVTRAVDYPQNPPAGGPHNPVWLNCGVYESTVPNENAVHSMEHGAVWVTYRSRLPDSDVATLRDELPDTYAILSPVDQLPAPVVVSAWGRQLRLDGPKDPRLKTFVDTYLQGPGTPEPGAACTGGTDGSVRLEDQPGGT